MDSFNRETFKYFDEAKKNETKAAWLVKNKARHAEVVKVPMTELVLRLNKALAADLPRIVISPRKITRPSRRGRDPKDTHVVKSKTYVDFSETKTSRFEWNPGIYYQMGATADDNFLGVGLYMVSSRQLSRLRASVVSDFGEIDAILSDRKLKKRWGGLKGEKYKRFPKGFDTEQEAAKYLWMKQFYLSKTYTRKEMTTKGFFKIVEEDLKSAMPFLKWIRNVVGTYR